MPRFHAYMYMELRRADVGRFGEEVERLALVDVGAAVGGHVDERAHGDLPHGAIDELDIVGRSRRSSGWSLRRA